MRLAVLVPSADYKAEWHWAFEPEAAPLRAAGAVVEAIEWTADIDFAGYDLVLPLVAWGYHLRFGEWLALLDRFEKKPTPVANRVTVLRWNSDKAYLAELAGKGVATVPSLAFASFSEQALTHARDIFGCADLVVKPTISASAYGTYRLGPGDPFPEPVRGWRMLVQPWIGEIVHSGEWSLIYFGGVFSHAVAKLPRAGEFRVQPEYGGIIASCDPPPGSRELAESALAAAPAPTTYARIDIVVGNDGALQVMELELVEPALFLEHAPEAGAAFAGAVLSAAETARE